MTLTIYRRSRSCRLTVIPADGEPVVLSNMEQDSGYSMRFRVLRTMDDRLGTLEASVYNLPPDLLGPIEASQVRRVDDLDAALAGVTLQVAGVDPDGAEAGPAGFAAVEVEAGYDGALTRIGRAVGCVVDSDREDDVTNVTTISALESLDGLLLGVPSATFPAGAATFEVVDYLRRCLGLGPGNLTPALWQALLGTSTLSAPYHATSGDALELLRGFMQYLAPRWWVDDRQFWVCGRDGVPNFGKVPPFLPGAPKTLPPAVRRPRRVQGGFVEFACFLAPDVVPGELVVLTPGALTFEGVTPSQEQVLRAQVPPGFYRAEQVEHTGDTSGDGEDAWTSVFLLRGMPG